MKEESVNRLKKILPFLKNVDFDDPKTKKSMTYIILLAVLVVLLLVALIFRLSKGGEKENDGPGVELLQGEPRDPNVSAASSTPLLEIPEGRDRDVLGADNMMEAYEGRRERPAGNRDIYERAGQNNDDPIGDIFSGDYRGYETPASDVAAQAADDPAPENTGNSGSSSRRTRSTSSSRSYSSGITRRNALEAFGLGSDYESESSSSENGSTSGASSPGNGHSRRDEIESQARSQAVAEEENTAEETEPAPTRVRRPNGITTLDDVAPRGSVLSSLANEGSDNLYIDTSEDALFKVMFLEGTKIKNGDKVRIMLIDDIVVDGVLVEHNTPLTATCSLGDRLMLNVPSVTINGHIHTLNFQAVDNDGQVGLYCPVTDATVKTEQAMDAISTVAQSELMTMITGVGGRLLQSGARAMKSGSRGSTTVSVDQGYQFYITKAKKML